MHERRYQVTCWVYILSAARYLVYHAMELHVKLSSQSLIGPNCKAGAGEHRPPMKYFVHKSANGVELVLGRFENPMFIAKDSLPAEKHWCSLDVTRAFDTWRNWCEASWKRKLLNCWARHQIQLFFECWLTRCLYTWKRRGWKRWKVPWGSFKLHFDCHLSRPSRSIWRPTYSIYGRATPWLAWCDKYHTQCGLRYEKISGKLGSQWDAFTVVLSDRSGSIEVIIKLSTVCRGYFSE